MTQHLNFERMEGFSSDFSVVFCIVDICGLPAEFRGALALFAGNDRGAS